MIYLLCQVLAITAFFQLLRFGQRSASSLWTVIWLNYAVGAFIAAGWCLFWTRTAYVPWAAGLGIAAGVCYILNIFPMMRAYTTAGVGVTSAVMSSSTVVPVVVAWLFWGDTMTWGRWLALPTVCFALVLLRPPQTDDGTTGGGTGALLLTFLITSMIGIISTGLSRYTAAADQPFYVMSLFITAGVLGAGYAAVVRPTHTRAAVAVGSATGAANVLATTCLIGALAVLSPGVVYPVGTAATVMLNVILARMLWYEKLAQRQVVGLVLAASTAFFVTL